MNRKAQSVKLRKKRGKEEEGKATQNRTERRDCLKRELRVIRQTHTGQQDNRHGFPARHTDKQAACS